MSKRKRKYPDESCESLNAARKIAKEVINRKIEASVGSAACAYETAIIDKVYRDLKAVSENIFEESLKNRVFLAGFEPITFLKVRRMAESTYVEGGALDFVYYGVQVQDLCDPRRRDVRMLGQKRGS